MEAEDVERNQSKRVSYPIHQSPLYRLKSHRKLALLLEVPVSELRRFRHSDPLYTEFDVRKKNGGTRRVENPKRALKRVQARVAKLLSRIVPPEYLFCPVKGRSYISNAARHQGNRAIRCLDVKKYFPSTLAYRVHWFFRSVMQCENDIADTLSSLATYRGHLPTGSPLSPILAFFAHYDVWEAVAHVAKTNGLTLTIYIDDLTISGARVPKKVMWKIEKIIHASGLRYHKEKQYFDRPAEITGILVTREKLSAPNRQHKKLFDAKAALSKATGKTEQAKAASRIAGLSGQLTQIRKEQGMLATAEKISS